MENKPPGEQIEEDNNKQARGVPAPIKNPTSGNAQEESNGTTQDEIANLEGRIKRAEKWMIGLTGVIAFSAICSVAVGILQWSVIKSGGTDTHTLAVAAQTQATKMGDMSDAAKKIQKAASGMVTQEQRIADNAKQSLNASNAQSQKVLNANIMAAHLEQRAWVAAVAVEMDTIESGKPISGYVVWYNSGRTFAKSVEPSCHFTTIPGPIANETVLENLAVPPIEQQSIGVLTPGAQYKTILKGIQPIPAIERDSIASTSNPWYTYIWGELTYRDVFGKKHTTIFCDSRRGVSGDFTQCQFHNDAD